LLVPTAPLSISRSFRGTERLDRMIDRMQQWLEELGLTGTSFFLLSLGMFVVTFLASLAVAAYVVVQLPATYFSQTHQPAISFWEHHVVLRWSVRIFKNVLGAFLVVLGILLSLPGVPGQGILTILIGIMLLDFPGRHRFERWLVSRPSVLRAVNRLRARYGRQPLVLDDDPAIPVGQ
jgi:hypothetical protein